MDGELQRSPPVAFAHQGPLPIGFTAPTLAAVLDAARAARMAGKDPAPAAREAAWGQHPALSAALIGDAVDYALARV